MSIKLLKISSVSDKMDCSRSTIRKMIKDGIFPEGVGEGKNKRWLEPEIDFYIAQYFNLDSSYYQKASDLLDTSQKQKIVKMVNKNKQINIIKIPAQLEKTNKELNKQLTK